MPTSTSTVFSRAASTSPPTTALNLFGASLQIPTPTSDFISRYVDSLIKNPTAASTAHAVGMADALNSIQPEDVGRPRQIIAQASETESTPGINTSVAAQQLREWHAELRAWKWPNRRDRKLGKGFQPRPILPPAESTLSTPAKRKEYLGSLPVTVVLRHEKRLAEIRAGLDDLATQELKDLVSSAQSPLSAQERGSGRVAPLPDFAAIVADTMLQTLPYLAKVTALTDDWQARITVLKQVPFLLSQFELVETAMEAALKNVCARDTNGFVTRAGFENTKDSLANSVSVLDANLDKMLGCLAGREDPLPERWITRVVEIKAKFAQWTTGAQRKVAYIEWMDQNIVSSLRESKSTHHAASTTAAQRANRPRIITISGGEPLPSRQARSLDLTGHPSRNESGKMENDRRTATEPWSAVYPTMTIRSPTISNPSPAGPFMRKREPAPIPLMDQARHTPPSLGIATVPARDGDGYTNNPRQVDVSSRRSKPTSDAHERSSRVHDVGATLDSVSEALYQHQRLIPDRENRSTAAAPRKDLPLSLGVPPASRGRRTSEISVAESMQSGALSGISTPEIFEATTVEAQKGPQGLRRWVRTSADATGFLNHASSYHESSPDQVKCTHQDASGPPFHQQKPSLSMRFKTSGMVSDETRDAGSPIRQGYLSTSVHGSSVPTVVHNAAFSCMEKVPRRKIRSIVVSRKGSTSSSLISPISSFDSSESFAGPDSAMSVSPLEDGPSWSMSTKSSKQSHSKESREAFHPAHPYPLQPSHRTDGHADLPSTRRGSRRRRSPAPGPNAVMPHTPCGRDLPSSRNESSAGEGPQDQDDPLESKIRSLVASIPTRIRLRSELKSEVPTSPPSTTSSCNQEPGPSFILNPVKVKHGSLATHGSNPNSDVRLFHLIRSAEASYSPPTTLFVRLAGKNADSVFVQVAGGGGRWTELGEFLRRHCCDSESGPDEQFSLAGSPDSGQRHNLENRPPWVDPELIPNLMTGGLSSTWQSFGDARHTPAQDRSRSPASPHDGSASPKRRRGAWALGTRPSGQHDRSPATSRSRSGRRDRSSLPLASTQTMPSTAEVRSSMISAPTGGSIRTPGQVYASVFDEAMGSQAEQDGSEDAAPAPNIGTPSSAAMVPHPSYGVAVAGVAVKVGPNSKLGEWSGAFRTGKHGSVGAVGGIRRVFLSRKGVTG